MTTKIIFSFIFLFITGIPVIFAYTTTSSDIPRPSVTNKKKYIKIWNSSSPHPTYPVKNINMGGAGCSSYNPSANPNVKYVQVGVTNMPNVSYKIITMTGEFDFQFSLDGSTCTPLVLHWKYYTAANSSFIKWVSGYNAAQIVCAPATVEWQ